MRLSGCRRRDHDRSRFDQQAVVARRHGDRVAVHDRTIEDEHRCRIADLALDDPLERLRLVITLLVLGREAVDDDPALDQEGRRGAAMSREHLRLAESRPDELQRALEPLIHLIAEELSVGMERGLVRPGDARRLARLVYNLVSTTVHTELLSQDSAHADREQLATEIWAFCHRAIAT